MAEPIVQPVGPLAQVSPAAVIVPVAAGGNKFQEDLMNSILANSKQKQDYIQQQQLAYENEMRQYSQQVAASRDPDSSANKAGLWGSIAAGAAQLPNTWGNMGAMIGNMGAAAGQFAQGKQQRDIENQKALTHSREANLRSAQPAAQQSAMLRALSPGGGSRGTWQAKTLDDGSTYRWNTATGEEKIIPATKSRAWEAARKQAYDYAVKNERADADTYAENYADQVVGGAPKQPSDIVERQTGMKPPAPSAVPSVPSAVSTMQVTPQEQAIRDVAAKRIQAGEQDGTLPDAPANAEVADVVLSPEDAALARRLMARIQANPAATTNDTATLNKMMQKYEKGAPAMSYIDKPLRKLEEATGAEAGKALGQEHSDLNAAAGSSSQMIGQLDLLKKLYQTPNMPEGQLATQLQSVRSGLKTLGLDVGDEVGAADMAASIAGKMALLTRTADGKNLMPGAMSDFEQKILASLVPGLSGTAEGRTALIDVMQAMARTRMRFAEEANKMAEANRGILPPEWNTRKQRVMKEEMARMAQLNVQIARRFQGAK